MRDPLLRGPPSVRVLESTFKAFPNPPAGRCDKFLLASSYHLDWLRVSRYAVECQRVAGVTLSRFLSLPRMACSVARGLDTCAITLKSLKLLCMFLLDSLLSIFYSSRDASMESGLTLALLGISYRISKTTDAWATITFCGPISTDRTLKLGKQSLHSVDLG